MSNKPKELYHSDGTYVLKSAYKQVSKELDEVRDLIQWLFDGIEHFTNEEDESQRNHLRNRAYEFLNKVSRE